MHIIAFTPSDPKLLSKPLYNNNISDFIIMVVACLPLRFSSGKHRGTYFQLKRIGLACQSAEAIPVPLN